jgi:hypothetical protein
VTDHELQVKTLQENVMDKSLKSSKPNNRSRLGDIDLKEDTCHHIMKLWIERSKGNEARSI